MTQDLELDDDLIDPDDDGAEVEEIPEIPAAPKKAPGRKKAAYARTPVKEFDIRAAHQAWKEKNGIEDDDYTW